MARTMSASGGFYKYRCKHFYAKSCQNWVYVNGEACITCLAEGCDAYEGEDLERPCAPEICVSVAGAGISEWAVVGEARLRDGRPWAWCAGGASSSR